MRYLYTKWVLVTLLGLLRLAGAEIHAQTPPNLTSGLPWSSWWNANTEPEIEAQFNAGRRHEESNQGLSPGSLGNLHLPSGFLNLDFEEQALILLNAARAARNGVQYGSSVYSVLPYEGVELDLCNVAQGHADYMQAEDVFSHTGSGGTSSNGRITGAFPGCTEGTCENIAWNSYSGSGFISAIPLAIYNFIYDDACCFWGHRSNCFRMSTSTNNYHGTSAFGMVGFGRSTGDNGDYFVMDFFDPRPESSCTYNITNFEAGSGDCPQNIVLNGIIASGTYQANISVNSSGMVPSTNTVELIASNSVTLNPIFTVELGSELTIEIYSCNDVSLKLDQPDQKWEIENLSLIGGIPSFIMD
ncbi:MAG: CAP domain-containing protein [Saprospiraceae bacterium]|nr:CAP domain-containing protein [Saprospiraceae bacterium]